MELGSIHPDEQSARRAVATLIGAGIEPERVKVMRPRPPRPQETPSSEPQVTWLARGRDASGGATLGAATAGLACLLVSFLDVPPIGDMNALVLYGALLLTGAVAGAAAALLIQWRYRELAALAHPRVVRRRARGWAVIVHARDTDQRALAARALARAARPNGPVAA